MFAASIFACAGVLHRIQQNGMLKEFSVLNHEVDAGNVHVHDAARANVQMTDLAVAHLPFGQTHERPAGMNERIRIFAQQPIVGRLVRERDGIGFRFCAITPAVENHQYKWFWTRHDSASGSWLLAPGFGS